MQQKELDYPEDTARAGRVLRSILHALRHQLTVEELEYWMCYNVIANAGILSIDISGMSFEDAIGAIDRENKKRKSKVKR